LDLSSCPKIKDSFASKALEYNIEVKANYKECLIAIKAQKSINLNLAYPSLLLANIKTLIKKSLTRLIASVLCFIKFKFFLKDLI
jgi:hypothetical protein